MSSLTVTRRFDSAPEQVYDAWLNPAAVGRWLFATPGGVMKRVDMDARVGGTFYVGERRGEILAEHWGTFVELDRPRRIVFDFQTDPSEPATRVTVEIASAPGGCMVTLSHQITPQWDAYRDRARIGWTMILGALDGTIETDREIVTTRVLNAPRELVWEAWTSPQHVGHWWGPNGFTTTVEVLDVRPGGLWKHIMHGPDGVDYPNCSVFIEVSPPQRLIYDHGGEKPGDPKVSFRAFATFDDLGERTRVTLRSVFPSMTERDRVARDYGAREGAIQHLGRLDTFVMTRLVTNGGGA